MQDYKILEQARQEEAGDHQHTEDRIFAASVGYYISELVATLGVMLIHFWTGFYAPTT